MIVCLADKSQLRRRNKIVCRFIVQTVRGCCPSFEVDAPLVTVRRSQSPADAISWRVVAPGCRRIHYFGRVSQ